MKIISLFNNKGGVGKTTLTYHVCCALSELGKKVLMIDLDPQCSLTILSNNIQELQKIWESENIFIDNGFEMARGKMSSEEYKKMNETPRTIHYLLKPTEEGTGDLDRLPPPIALSANLDLLPGRLTLHMYENKITERWAGVYSGDPLAIRTITKIHKISADYAACYNYDYIVIDTSPSLGMLNKVIISTADGFATPCYPDMFSLYGIRNIGRSLEEWRKEFEIVYSLISEEKRKNFPVNFVQFLGYTIYNAKKYEDQKNEYALASVSYNYVKKIPETIKQFIPMSARTKIPFEKLKEPIGEKSIMYTHNTLPNMVQKYHHPMWELPLIDNIERSEQSIIYGSPKQIYLDTKDKYVTFTQDLIRRIEILED